MDVHHLLADRAQRAATGLTAFSALPNAPVQPHLPSRRDRLVAAWHRRRTAVRPPQALRPAPAAGRVASTTCDLAA